jgi:hypothetical protein
MIITGQRIHCRYLIGVFRTVIYLTTIDCDFLSDRLPYQRSAGNRQSTGAAGSDRRKLPGKTMTLYFVSWLRCRSDCSLA